MKSFLFGLCLLFSTSTFAQYYYNDVIGTRESADLLQVYLKNKVKKVLVKSYTIDNTPIDNFFVQQQFDPAKRYLQTITKTAYSNASYLTTYADESGRIVKTLDSSAGITNQSEYRYNSQGYLASVSITFGDTLSALKSDEHIWQYDKNNKLKTMLRIKNKQDTAIVSFLLDEKGNVVEEQEARRTIKEEPFYYYYDEDNRLTDIVRFNTKAGRLLPQMMFEYGGNDKVIQRISIPQNSTEYLIWRFQFNEIGLKMREVIYNKEKELTGKIEYQYSFQ